MIENELVEKVYNSLEAVQLPGHKIDRFHLPLHHMTERKFHLLAPATTLKTFLRILSPQIPR
jgi:hypothetical protein